MRVFRFTPGIIVALGVVCIAIAIIGIIPEGENQVRVDGTDEKGKTALMYAAEQGSSDVCSALLYRGADPTIADQSGWTAMHYAAFCGYENIVQQLEEAGANINAKTVLDSTPLVEAVLGGHASIVKFLLDEGASMEEKDVLGKTVNDYAGFHEEIKKMLEEERKKRKI